MADLQSAPAKLLFDAADHLLAGDVRGFVMSILPFVMAVLLFVSAVLLFAAAVPLLVMDVLLFTNAVPQFIAAGLQFRPGEVHLTMDRARSFSAVSVSSLRGELFNRNVIDLRAAIGDRARDVKVIFPGRDAAVRILLSGAAS